MCCQFRCRSGCSPWFKNMLKVPRWWNICGTNSDIHEGELYFTSRFTDTHQNSWEGKHHLVLVMYRSKQECVPGLLLAIYTNIIQLTVPTPSPNFVDHDYAVPGSVFLCFLEWSSTFSSFVWFLLGLEINRFGHHVVINLMPGAFRSSSRSRENNNPRDESPFSEEIFSTSSDICF